MTNITKNDSKVDKEDWVDKFDEIGIRYWKENDRTKVVKFIQSLLSETAKTARDEGFECGCQNANRMAKEAYVRGKLDAIKIILLDYELNALMGKGYDFYFVLKTTFDQLLSNAKKQGIIIKE